MCQLPIPVHAFLKAPRDLQSCPAPNPCPLSPQSQHLLRLLLREGQISKVWLDSQDLPF